MLVLTAGAAPASDEQRASLTRVDASNVCMMNDKRFAEAQIPVEVDGGTYYGCCAMCKDRLGNDPSSRVARDPITDEEVDKSSAVIIRDTTGKVLYFASEDTLRRYRG
jgi:YHS domain-containing protein